MCLVHRISITELRAAANYPLTRENVVGITKLVASPHVEAICIVIVADHGLPPFDEPIELARIELGISDGECFLWYVSHAAQCEGLTEQVLPMPIDFSEFVRRATPAEETGAMNALTPICANDLEISGLGPLASLDLRNGRLAPVVPFRDHLAQLIEVLDRSRVAYLCWPDQ